MQNLLVNLAIVKANSEKNLGVLDNYIPIFAFCLKQIGSEFVSSAVVQEKFSELAEFKPPQAVILSLIKRAAKKYKFLERGADGVYKILRENLPANEYEKVRDAEIRKFNGLKIKFVEYCKKFHGVDVGLDDVESGFFETLYLFAPKLYKSVSVESHALGEHAEQQKLLTAKFIQHCDNCDNEALSVIEAFVRGAMLTEVFYYSEPDRVDGALRDIRVFFDTDFLIRALGFCDSEVRQLSTELIDMLAHMGTKMRCFRDTLNEIDGILYAAQLARGNGALRAKRPGDVFDYYSFRGASVSDIKLDRSMLERKLKLLGIQVEDRPSHVRELGLDETQFSKVLDNYLIQKQDARRHDIDCITAIHRIRGGRSQNYLESCIAIFVTTNALLSKGVTEFFKGVHGRSDIAVCMPDQVFTTLIWMKAVKKKPLLPAQMIVANCIASLQPTQENWSNYLYEIDKLERAGDITAEDFYLLVHSTEARSILTDSIVGANEPVYGSPKKVLEMVKENLIGGFVSDKYKDSQTIDGLVKVVERIKGGVSLVVTNLVVGLFLVVCCYMWLWVNSGAVYSDVLELKITKGFFCAVLMAVLSLAYILFSIPGYKLIRRAGQLAANWLIKKIIGNV